MGDVEGLIFDIKKYAIHDGPGIRTTVFLKGCPLSCPWCHNPEGISSKPHLVYRKDLCIGCGECLNACPNGAIVNKGNEGFVTIPSLCKGCGTCAEVCPAEAREIIGRKETVQQVLEEIEKDVPFYDTSGGGVTFSGGEPLMQPGFLVPLLEACGERGIHRAVDTSGYADPATLMAVAERTDLFLFDIKLMDPDRHRALTGVSNERILSNLFNLAGTGAKLAVRIPLIPGINDDEENLERTATFLKGLPNGISSIHILPYHETGLSKYKKLGRDYRFRAIGPPSDNHIATVVKRFSDMGLEVKIGG